MSTLETPIASIRTGSRLVSSDGGVHRVLDMWWQWSDSLRQYRARATFQCEKTGIKEDVFPDELLDCPLRDKP